ncbi:MAG: MATE family efflux transporter [Lachnospiraceae bacterium]|nr:MATE family efflux transporter [Lachnospiraceae bacterium]
MHRSIDMTSGNTTKLLLQLAIPLILTNLGQQMYSIVDAIIVGRNVGVSAFASLGACDWLYYLVLWSILALTQGFSAVVAQNFGSGNKEKFRKSVCMCILVTIVIGILYTVVSTSAAVPLLRLLGTEDSIFSGARTYLTAMYAGSLIVLGYNMAAAILRAVGDGKTPLIAMIVAGFCNVGLDVLFVAVFRWGILGAAFATLLAQLIAFLYCYAVMRKSDVFHMQQGDFLPDKSIILQLCRLGIPQAISQSITVIGGIYAQSVINAYGYIVVAGCTAANKLHGLMDTSSAAFGFASSTFLGQNYGAKKMDRVRSGIRRGIVISLCIAGIILLTMVLFGHQIVGLFLSKDVTDAAAALDVTYRYTMVMAYCLPMCYLMNLFRYSLQGIGNTVAPMLSGICEMGARICATAFLPAVLGQLGLFLMDGSAWAAAGIFQMTAFFVTLHRIQKNMAVS